KPGSIPVEENKEIEIIKKYTKLIKQKFPKIIVSVDTFRSSVAEIAIENNADIINDISAGKFDSRIFDVVAKNNLPYILMHMQGEPKSMQERPSYKNIIIELLDFFEKKINFLNNKGIKNIIIDPGFGFGKSLENNYTILKNLEKFQKFGYPIIAGVSRKSMLTKLLDIDSKDALNSTTIVNTIAVSKGCKILRVHDVKQAKEILKILDYLKEK
ncbi:dihydropteroate synthase, partial [Bacteroidota bacterium]|nr:dihydropteroate synthase [Bacteroidota bacterium]